MELFDIIPDNFFSILSSKNKRLYLACAMQAFSVYETASILGIERKTIADDLTIFLENRDNLYSDDETEFKDSLEEPQTKRDLANLVLRRLEECGWIYIDVTSDYVELLNFTDYAITILEALMSICPMKNQYDFAYDDDEDPFMPEPIINPNEYQGYIYTIYSLLNSDITDYHLVIEQVYKNTKMLIRSLRKMDSRIKDYINLVVETSEIKDLMNKLIDYNNEIYQPSYAKLKTSDNINKYRLNIVTKLEEIASNEEAMEAISKGYIYRCKTRSQAIERANRDIDEMVDVFNMLDDYITGIDAKNKTYINSTIGKIKFLLTEEDNIIGKLNTILKYVKLMNAKGKQEQAMNNIKKVVNINSVKGYSNNSLYSPRGKYSRSEYQMLDLDRFDFTGLDEALINGFHAKYNPLNVRDFIMRRLDSNNSLTASSILSSDATKDDMLMILFILIYASENNYRIEKLIDTVNTNKYSITNFRITKEGE
ncbi:MAG: Wadjet anti-phage system protein JetA family protein [Anaeroplasmataceae bacterium]